MSIFNFRTSVTFDDRIQMPEKITYRIKAIREQINTINNKLIDDRRTDCARAIKSMFDTQY